MSTHPIPQVYRIPMLWIEPPLALIGTYLLYFDPSSYLDAMSPYAHTQDALDQVRVFTDQLALFHLVFAFNVGVVLRVTRDVLVWQVMCAGILIGDVLTATASVRELGWERTLSPSTWRSEEWTNFCVLGVMGFIRLLIVLGVGVGGGDKRKRA